MLYVKQYGQVFIIPLYGFVIQNWEMQLVGNVIIIYWKIMKKYIDICSVHPPLFTW